MIKRTWLYEIVAERAWPVVAHFCDSKFPEPSKEKSYLKEVHFTLRRGAICASLCEFWARAAVIVTCFELNPIIGIFYGSLRHLLDFDSRFANQADREYRLLWLYSRHRSQSPRLLFSFQDGPKTDVLPLQQIFIIPLPLLVIFDMVKTRPFFYQAWLWCATWSFSIILLVDM